MNYQVEIRCSMREFAAKLPHLAIAELFVGLMVGPGRF